MARTLRFAFAAASASVLGLFISAGPARADQAAGAASPSFTGCQVAIATKDMSLPANAPALLVTDTSNQAAATVTAELVSSEGRAALGAPARDAHGLLVMTLPLASVGAHTLATKVACSTDQAGSTPPAPTETETPITLTAPVDFPTTVGVLSVRANPEPRGTDTISLDASPALRAFAAVAVVELSVNGQLAGGAAGSARPGFADQYSVATGSVCVENGELHRDVRTVRVSVSAHLAGVADSPAPATIDIVVDCGKIRWTSERDFDGSTDTSSGGEPDGTPRVTSRSAGGCSAAPSSRTSGSSVAFAAGAALGLALLGRRRRAHPHRASGR